MRDQISLDAAGRKTWTTADEIKFLSERAHRPELIRGWLRGAARRSDWGTIQEPHRAIGVARQILGLTDRIPPALPAMVQ